MDKKSITKYPNAPDIESSTPGYAARFHGPVGEWFLEVQNQATRELVRGSNLKVLDVGGGHGQNIQTITGLGHSLTILGSDESCTQMIKQEITNQQVEFQSSSLLNLPYEDNSFDLVISYRTVSHMEQWEKLLDELTRVASLAVIIDYPSTQSFNIISNALFSLKKKVEKNTRRYLSFKTADIDQAFEQRGFIRDGQQKQFFLPMALHRLLRIRAFSSTSEKIFKALGLTTWFGSPVVARFIPK